MMILDTNVISELMKESPNKNVVNWIAEIDVEQIYTTAITIAELHYGIQSLPQGKRKLALQKSLSSISSLFNKRILSFDEKTAPFYANVTVRRKEQGQPISVLDAQIAAICSRHKMPLATRSVTDFVSLELEVFNPWD